MCCNDDLIMSNMELSINGVLMGMFYRIFHGILPLDISWVFLEITSRQILLLPHCSLTGRMVGTGITIVTIPK